jgi:hypothetical protein
VNAYRSPWYTGPESSLCAEPYSYQQWRQARSDWAQTQRPADFERMLAAVTLDNPPLASDVARKRRAVAAKRAVANATKAIVGLTIVIVAAILALAIIMVQAGRQHWPSRLDLPDPARGRGRVPGNGSQ